MGNDGAPEKVRGLIVEDDPIIVELEKTFLASFGSCFQGITVVAALFELRDQLKTLFLDSVVEAPSVFFIDSTVKGGEVSPGEVLEVLAQVRDRMVAVIFQSGKIDSVHAAVEAWIQGRENRTLPNHLFVDFLEKPWNRSHFLDIVAKALTYVLGRTIESGIKGVTEGENRENPTEQSSPDVPLDVFHCSSLGQLMEALPQDFSHISFKETCDPRESLPFSARKVACLLSAFLRVMKCLTGQLQGARGVENMSLPPLSFEEMKKFWFTVFPPAKAASRRCFFECIFKELEGANAIVSSCIHDVNNVLARHGDVEPEPEVWDKECLEIWKIVDGGLSSFEDYLLSSDAHRFFRSQDIGDALNEFSGQEEILGIFLQNNLPNQGKGLSIDLPAGTLVSIFRTFSSNYLKVRQRCSNPTSARMEVEAHVEGNEVVISFQNNLESFPEENLMRIFDTNLESRHGHGSGTGLRWTAEVVRMGKGKISSYHRRPTGEALEKSPGLELRPVDSSCVESTFPQGFGTRFELRLPLR